MRQQVGALAYLDIDADNGGIVLNMSEEGMAFQAVGPLEHEARVNLRIQLPHSRTRIETAAQVVWLSESKRHAGVRFVDIPPDVRAKIQEWLRSEISPSAPSQGLPLQQQNTTEPQRKPEVVREAGRETRLDSTAKYPRSRPSGGTTPRISQGPERHRPAPANQKPAETPTGTHSAASREDKGARPPEKPLLTGIETQTAPPGPADHARGGAVYEGFLDRLGSGSRTAPSPAVEPPTPPPTSAVPRPVLIDANRNLTAVHSDTPVPRAKASRHARKWIGIVVLLVLLAILSIGIGMRFGSVSRHVHPERSMTATSPVPISESASSVEKKRNTSGLARKISRKAHTENTQSDSAVAKPKASLPTSAPSLLRPQQNVSSAPITKSLTPQTATAPPEIRPVPAPVPAPLPADSAAGPPAPRIVAGRALGPTDRFNPCHLTYRVEPVYPPRAKEQGIEGAVRIHLVIGADGSVSSMKLLSGPSLLAPAAMDAAKYWRYMPALLNGQPVETEQDIEIDFQLPH